jgi:hypothetical protein
MVHAIIGRLAQLHLRAVLIPFVIRPAACTSAKSRICVEQSIQVVESCIGAGR